MPAVRPRRLDPVTVMPADAAAEIDEARRSASDPNLDPATYQFPIVRRHPGPGWRRPRWAWYVAFPFGSDARSLLAADAIAVFVEYSGRAWTERGAHRAIRAANRRAMRAPTYTGPDPHLRDARAFACFVALGCGMSACALTLCALFTAAPWHLITVLALLAAISTLGATGISRLLRARTRARAARIT